MLSPLTDGTLEDYDWELLFAWGGFCQDRYAASFMDPYPGLVAEFAEWLSTRPRSGETNEAAARWWKARDLGLMSWERKLLRLWMAFSDEEYSAGFMTLEVSTAAAFSRWLAGASGAELQDESST